MRKLFILLVFVSCGVNVVVAQNPQKRKARVSYIHKTAGLNKEQQQKVAKTLDAYLDELHASKKKHDAVKDRYQAMEDKGKLTEAAAVELMESKFAKEERELKIDRKYFVSLRSVVGAVKAREIVKCAGDKLKK